MKIFVRKEIVVFCVVVLGGIIPVSVADAAQNVPKRIRQHFRVERFQQKHLSNTLFRNLDDEITKQITEV